MEERRKYPRSKTYKGATISTETLSGLPCAVRNMSIRGVCIELEDETPIPDHFSLIIKPELKRRSCEVVWRRGRKIGVKFSD